MKLSIRTKFTMGMIFIFVIILVLSIFSGVYLNRMSNKTGAILKENYLSVVYAREMNEGLVKVNEEILTGFLEHRNLDSHSIQNELVIIDKSLQLEKGNITEPGEDKLVAGIESGINEYRDSVVNYLKNPPSAEMVLYFQKKTGIISQELVLLSQMNGKAIESKTDDAKSSAKTALTQMTMLAAICFLLALSFIYSFSSYFNERFFQLYNGIKEISSNNYGQRLYFEGKDEFNDISLVFNQMAEKLSTNRPEKPMTYFDDSEVEDSYTDLEELKGVLVRMRIIEKQAEDLISRINSKE